MWNQILRLDSLKVAQLSGFVLVAGATGLVWGLARMQAVLLVPYFFLVVYLFDVAVYSLLAYLVGRRLRIPHYPRVVSLLCLAGAFAADRFLAPRILLDLPFARRLTAWNVAVELFILAVALLVLIRVGAASLRRCGDEDSELVNVIPPVHVSYLLAVAAIATVFATLLLVALTVTATDLRDVIRVGADDEQGRAIAEAGAEAVQDVIIGYVEDQPLSLANFLERKAQIEANLETMRQMLMDGVHNGGHIQARLDLMEEAGTETVALASLIIDLAVFQKALDQGYLATEDEVQRHVASVRQAYETGQLDDPASLGYIEAIGEERYWTEVYPRIAKRYLSVEKMREALMEELAPTCLPSTVRQADWQEATIAWRNFEAETALAAEVILPCLTARQVDPDSVHPATVEGAFDYIEAARDSEVALAARSP